MKKTKAELAVEAVLGLHDKLTGIYWDHNDHEWYGDYCPSCLVEWPCTTVETIQEALSE